MARFAVNTSNDQSASAWIVTLLSVIYSALTLGLRLWVKYGLLGLDNAGMAAAYVLALAQQATTMYTVAAGVARDDSATPGIHHAAIAKVRQQIGQT